MATVDLPLTVLGAGGYQFGPYPVADTDTQVALVVDRTPGVGLNSLDDTTVIAVTVAQSSDGGGAWTILNTGTVTGGAFQDTSEVSVSLAPATSRVVRVDIAVTGHEVAISGSFTSS